MYKVVIVDDEEAIIKGLELYIKTMNKGFSVVGMFNDGYSAVEFIKNNDVDVVFTDIKMPGMSGIDLIDYIYNNKPYIHTVIISAYGEFEYARAAIKYNVEGFIIKPTIYSEVLEIADKIKANLDNERKSIVSDTSKEQYIDMINEYIYKSVFGGDRNKTINNNIKQLLYDMHYKNYEEINNSKYCIFNILIRGYEKFVSTLWVYGRDSFNELIHNFLHESAMGLSIKFYQIDLNDSTLKFIAYSGQYNEINDMVSDIVKVLEKLNENLAREININTEFQMLAVSDSITQLIENYEDETDNDGAEIAPTISLALKYINEHYDKDISLYDVAKYVNMSACYFSRFFKQYTGKKFSDYLIDIRIEKAKKLIIEGKYRVSEICDMVGYRSVSYFGKIFKLMTDCTPREYYLKYRKDDDTNKKV